MEKSVVFACLTAGIFWIIATVCLVIETSVKCSHMGCCG